MLDPKFSRNFLKPAAAAAAAAGKKRASEDAIDTEASVAAAKPTPKNPGAKRSRKAVAPRGVPNVAYRQ